MQREERAGLAQERATLLGERPLMKTGCLDVDRITAKPAEVWTLEARHFIF